MSSGSSPVEVLGHDGHVADRDGRADAVGLGDVVAPGVHGGDRRRLGQAVAVGGLPDGPGRPDAAHQVGRRRRAAVGDAADGRGVVLGEVGRVEHLHDHGRHAAEGADPLPLDQLEGALGVEVVHHHELPAGGQVGDHDRVAAGGVEERHREQEGRPAVFSPAGLEGRAAEAGGAAGVDEEEAHQVRAHVAVGADRALGAPRWCPRCRRWWRRPPDRWRGRAAWRPRRRRPAPAGRAIRAPAPSAAAARTRPAGALGSVRCSSATMTAPRSGRPPRNGRMRSTRSVSTKATLEPESSSP